MSLDTAFQGSLFANDFLCDSVSRTADWEAIDDAALDNLEAALRASVRCLPLRWHAQREPDRGRPDLARAQVLSIGRQVYDSRT